MSHLQERKKTNCLNCNAEVTGKFCSVCGQENLEPAESAWHLITHFFNDITHFDGKFFSSLKYLILKPGFLSAQYKAGRRANYLNPVRMYVFTSFVFFLVFFSVYHFDKPEILVNGKDVSPEMIDEMDSAAFKKIASTLDSTKLITRDEARKKLSDIRKKGFGISEFRDKAQYDSLLASGAKKDGWLMRKIAYRQLELKKKYDNDSNKMLRELMAIFTHSVPQMLFVSLPLFALFLKLLYWRNKSFYYVSHVIFSLHLYIFTFIIMLVIIGINQLHDVTHIGFLNTIAGFLYVISFFYEYKAMRNYYGQRRAKTIVKFIILNLYLFFIVSIIFVAFMIFSFLKA